MTRHCTRCDAEVEDTGGYCLLGHPLRFNMETASLDDLKKEVEAAFTSAQDEVRDGFSPLLEQVESIPAAREPEPAYAAAVATMPARYAAPPQPQQMATVAAPSAPAPAAQRTAPPPPPPSREVTKFETLWDNMEGGKELDRQDPINAFAPPPRMDWGPERSERKARGLRRLRASNA